MDVVMPSTNRTTNIQDDILEILTEFDTFLDNVFESPLSSPNSDTSDRTCIPTIPPPEEQKDIDEELERLQNFENAQKFFKNIGNAEATENNTCSLELNDNKKYLKGLHNEGDEFENKKFILAHNHYKFKKGIVDDEVKVTIPSGADQSSSPFPLDVLLKKQSSSLMMKPNVKKDNFKHGQCSPPMNFVKFSECLRLPAKAQQDRPRSSLDKIPYKPEKRNISSPKPRSSSATRPHKLEKKDISSPILIETTITCNQMENKRNVYSPTILHEIQRNGKSPPVKSKPIHLEATNICHKQMTIDQISAANHILKEKVTNLPDDLEEEGIASSFPKLQNHPLTNQHTSIFESTGNQECRKLAPISLASNINREVVPANVIGLGTSSSTALQSSVVKAKEVLGNRLKPPQRKEIEQRNVSKTASSRIDASIAIQKYSKSKLGSAGGPLTPILEGSQKLGIKHTSSPVLNSQLHKYDKVIGELNLSRVSCDEISTSFVGERPKSVSFDRFENNSAETAGFNCFGRRAGSIPRSGPDSFLPSKEKIFVQSRSESVPRSNLDFIIQSKSERVLRSNPGTTTQSRSESVPRSNLDITIQSKSERVLRSNPGTTTQSRSESVPRSYPNNVIESRSESVPRSNLDITIQSKSERVLRSNPGTTTQSRSESVPRSNLDIVIQSKSERVLRSNPGTTTQSRSESVPRPCPNSLIESRSESVPRFSNLDTIIRSRLESRPIPLSKNVDRSISESMTHSDIENNLRFIPENIPPSNPKNMRQVKSESSTCSFNEPPILGKAEKIIPLHPDNRPIISLISQRVPRSRPECRPITLSRPEINPRPRPESIPPAKPPRTFIDKHENFPCSKPESLEKAVIGPDEDIVISSNSLSKSEIQNPKYEVKNLTSFRVLSRNPAMVAEHSPTTPTPLVLSNVRTSALQNKPPSSVENDSSEKDNSQESGSAPPCTLLVSNHEGDSIIDNVENLAYVHSLLSSHSAKIAAGIMSMEHRGTKALELWSRRVTQGYDGVNVSNMTTSWRDGLAFCALIHHFRPDLIDFKSLKAEKILENNALAFRVAEQHLGIPALLDAEDMVETSIPDRLSILTYVSQFYQAFNAQGLIGPGGRLSPLAANNAKNINPSKIPLNHKSPIPPPIVLTKTTPKAQPISQPPATLQTKTEKEFKTDKVTAGVRGRREICTACNKTVFLAERLAVGFPGQLRHRTCFRCDRCSAQLTLASYYETEKGQFCCETCPDEERPISSGDEGDRSVLERESASKGTMDDSSSSDSESDSDDSVGSGDNEANEQTGPLEKSISPEPGAEARSVFLQKTLDMDDTENISIRSLPLSLSPMMQESDVQSLPPEFLLPLPSSPPPPKPARSSLNFSQDDKECVISPSFVNAQPPSPKDTNECLSGLSRCDYTKSEETTPPSDELDTGQTNLERDTSNYINLKRKKLFEQDLNNKDNKIHSNICERQSASDISQNVKPEELRDSPRNGPQVASIRVIFENNSKVPSVPKDSENTTKDLKLKSKDKVSELTEKFKDLQKPDEPLGDSAVSATIESEGKNVEQAENYDNKSSILKSVYAKDDVDINKPTNVPSIVLVPSEINLNKEQISQVDETNPFDSFSDEESIEKRKFSDDRKESNEEENVKKCIPDSDNKYGEMLDDIESALDVVPMEIESSEVDLVQQSKVLAETMETSAEALNYPVELNPFDDDDDATTETKKELPDERIDVKEIKSVGDVKETKSVEDFTSQGSSPMKTIKAPINPFDSEEDVISEVDISKLKLNPFWSDDESDSSASTPSKKKIKPPRPPPPTLRRDVMPPSKNRKLILPNSGLATPPSPSLSNRSSSSDQSTFRLKKKQRHAPAPPSLYISPFQKNNNSMALQINQNPTGDACGTDDPISRKMQKDLQNRTNKMMGSSYSRDAQNSATALSGIVTPKSERGEWRRKKGPAPLRPVPQKRAIRKLPIRQIQQELYDIEVKQTELERQGVLLETVIREKTEGSVSGSSGDDSLSVSTANSEADKSFSSLASNNSDGSHGVEVEDMILQLFELVNEKNELFRRQTELMYLKREKRLEEEYAELEYQIRCLMLKPQSEKSEIEISQEEELIGRLVKVVEQRDQVVNCLEMERQREAIEDESIASHMIKYQEKHIEGIDSDGRESSKKKKKKKLRLLKKKKKGKNKEKEEKVDADKDVDETEVKKEKKKKRNWFKKPNLDKS